MVESKTVGDVVTKKIKVKIKNTSDQVLNDFTAKIDSFPNYTSCSETILSFGSISPGDSSVSADSVELIIDTSRQSSNELRLIWQIESDINGDRIMDEAAVVENF